MHSTRIQLKSARASSRTSSSKGSIPATPDGLKLFTDYGFVARERTPAVDFLSYLLSKTSLTTKKLTHQDIQEIGENVHQDIIRNCNKEKIAAVKEAVALTQENADKKLKQELSKAAKIAADEKRKELLSMRQYYEALAKRTSLGRDSLEEERKRKLIVEMEHEKKVALQKQWEEAERIKEELVERLLTEQKIKLRSEAALSREKAVAEALRNARERFADRLEREIERTKEICGKIADEEIEKVQQLHHVEVTRLRERIVQVESQMKEMSEKMMKAQREYWEMENEYCNFLDYTSQTDLQSGFLISPRKHKHGKSNSNKEQNVQTRLIALDQGSKTVQTDVKMPILR